MSPLAGRVKLMLLVALSAFAAQFASLHAMNVAHAAIGSHLKELTLASSFSTSPEPLTTELVWARDPDELNPHRKIWLLDRETHLEDLVARADRTGKVFRLAGGRIRATSRLLLRGPGPWYSELSKFRCEKEPDFWFFTRQGVEHAGQTAARAWESILGERKLQLTLRLERVSATSEVALRSQASRIFDEWLADAEERFRKERKTSVREEEWAWYQSQARSAGLCGKSASAPASSVPTWKELMPPPAATPTRTLLARAPAKRWDGLFSVRASVEVAGTVLNGQFLIDSSTPESILSPTWLEAQGVNSKMIEVPGDQPHRVHWTGGVAVARRGYVDQVQVAGASVPLNKFYIVNTSELYVPPDYVSTCCDGILGADFLRQFAVEFIPGGATVTGGATPGASSAASGASAPPVPAAVVLWNRSGFDAGAAMPWVEVSTSPAQELVSAFCSLKPGGNASAAPSVPGAVWETGNNAILEVRTPWKAALSGRKNPDLVCSGMPVATSVPLGFSDAGDSARVPGFRVGMGLLARRPFIFDLAHGRLWFSPDASGAPFIVNRSGLSTRFAFSQRGDRKLEVTSSNAVKIGLKRGALIEQIDGRPVDEMDQWEVDQRLSGAYGKQITLKWKNGKAEKVATLPLR